MRRGVEVEQGEKGVWQTVLTMLVTPMQKDQEATGWGDGREINLGGGESPGAP